MFVCQFKSDLFTVVRNNTRKIRKRTSNIVPDSDIPQNSGGLLNLNKANDVTVTYHKIEGVVSSQNKIDWFPENIS